MTTYNNTKFTPDPLEPSMMDEKDIFVFGSNTQGKHMKGAARAALFQYDAIYGQAEGLQGNSYAICVKDLALGIRSIPLEEIAKQFVKLLWFAFEHKDLTFYVTKIGTGLGGFTIDEMASIFDNKIIPANVILPKEFVTS